MITTTGNNKKLMIFGYTDDAELEYEYHGTFHFLIDHGTKILEGADWQLYPSRLLRQYCVLAFESSSWITLTCNLYISVISSNIYHVMLNHSNT